MFTLLTRRLPTPPLFPYTTLFRSGIAKRASGVLQLRDPSFVHSREQRARSSSRPDGFDGPENPGDRASDALEHRAHQGVLDHRSEEHTSELQSLTNLVCRLLLEKK